MGIAGSLRISTGLLLSVAVLSCSRLGTGVRPVQSPAVEPDAPVILHGPSRSLLGKDLADIVAVAETTVAQVPLDSFLIRNVASDVSGAVVSIYTKTETPYSLKLIPSHRPGFRFSVPGEALGSAFFVHGSGYLLTNAHVVENATRITARTKEGRDYPAVVIARDPVLDLALMKVEGAGADFPVISMGDSEAMAVGDWVIAVGNPLGLGHTVTHGIISQTGRNLELSATVKEGRHIRFLQTDTAINPGSSGGPLISLTGAWIGVNTAVIMGSQGISFAVPSEQVKEFIQSVLDGNGEYGGDPPR